MSPPDLPSWSVSLDSIYGPFYYYPLSPRFQCCSIQHAQSHQLYFRHDLSSTPASPLSLDQRHSTFDFRWVVVCNACPYCRRFPKLPDRRFCSVACTLSAARSAPELTYLLPHHELSIQIATRFVQCWNSGPRPKVLAVYMINWSEASRKGFERYREGVEARRQFKRLGRFSGNEHKLFRGTSRGCHLGERGNVVPCIDEACWTCQTIRLGFEPHLRRKRNVPLNGIGIRLGAGIYTSSASSKAGDYVWNMHDPSSTTYAMFVCRVVIGEPYVMYHDDPGIRCPPKGYDSVFGKSGRNSHFTEDEYAVYDANAIRPAYLILYGH